MLSFNNSVAKKFIAIRQKATHFPKKSNKILCKSQVIIALILLIIYIFFSCHHQSNSSKPLLTSLNKKSVDPLETSTNPSTNISHIVFVIAGTTSKAWGTRKNYIQSWWKRNVTQGFLFLDDAPIEHLPWPSVSLPVKLYQNTLKYKDFDKHALPFAIKMALMIADIFKEETKNVRWYVMVDDDTVLFTSNLVEVLSRYDHGKYFYIGKSSECILSNFENSFDTAFGGAGFALSFPLAEALANNIETCVKRYPTLLGRDHILQSCVADLGVSLTQEKGFHQIDLHNDISGLLSVHPPTPLLSLHHLDYVEPIFPSMNRYQSVNHLMKAAKIDEPRLLQQSICYLKQYNWTFSISWGYSTHIYEKITPPSVLERPLETFTQWTKGAKTGYMFNTRALSRDPCEAPHVFYFDSVEKFDKEKMVVTSYIRRSSRLLPACLSTGNHSAEHISIIQVLSPMKIIEWVGKPRECCDIKEMRGNNSTIIKLRTCLNDEIAA